MKMARVSFIAVTSIICLFSVCMIHVKCEDIKDEATGEKLDEKQLEYAKGSLCGYCDYCKVSI